MKFTTKRCSLHRHPEFTFICDMSIVPDTDAQWLIGYLEGQVARGESFKDNETIQIGWMIDRLHRADDGLLHILEPDMAHVPVRFVDSATHTLKFLRAQKDTLESCSPDWEPVFPSPRDAILVAKNYPVTKNIYLAREKAEGQWSGWILQDTTNTTAAPSEDAHEMVSLYEFACRRPDLVKFLALPPDIGVHITADGRIRISRDAQELPLRAGSFLDKLNQAVSPFH